jgi:hypothetical protein
MVRLVQYLLPLLTWMHDYTFNYTVPASYDEDKMKLVGLLIDQTTGNVINAVEVDMNFNAGLEDNSTVKMNLYPNPASDVANIQLDLLNTEDITVTVMDLNGKAVYTHYYGQLSGTQYLTVPVNTFAKGQYLVSVATPQKSYTRQLIVK